MNFADGGNGVAAAGAVIVIGVVVLNSWFSYTNVLFFYSYRTYFGHTVNELINC